MLINGARKHISLMYRSLEVLSVLLMRASWNHAMPVNQEEASGFKHA